MKTKYLEVSVKLKDGSTLPEVTHNGVTYLIAASGQEFSVHVRRRSSVHHMLKVGLKVDGHGVHYSKLLSNGATQAFEGVIVEEHGASLDRPVTMKRFQFAEAGDLDVEAAPAENLDFKVGKLELTVTHVRPGPPKNPHDVIKHKEVDSKAPQLHDGKKWFYAPSLHAGGGKETQTHIHYSRFKSIKVAELEDIQLRYETAATLVLRKIVDPSNPQHSQLIQPFLQQEADRLVAEGVKQERRRAGQASSSRAVAPAPRQMAPTVTVDLTQNHPVVKPEPRVGLKLKADEFAACDLTGPDDGPVWKVMKKPRIAID